MKELTAQNVDVIVKDCLYKPEEVTDGKTPEGARVVESIMRKWGFHPQRLESHRQDVIDMLSQLPDEFISGGGWSFLNMCVRKDGVQWGEHSTMDTLIAIGMALGLVSFPLPRDMWNILPGGMPYVTVKLPEAKSAA